MRLESGRKFFYQWELNQRLEVPEGCTQVHFANGTTDKAQVLEAFEENAMRLVKVPDEMLQVAAQLRCYAWDGASVIEHTVFDVVPREKPDDYVYEPEEVRRFDKLEAELVALAEQTKLWSQGRSAKYNFTSPGWKRVLNIIRGSGGVLTFSTGQSYMCQTAGIVFSAFVKYGRDTSSDKKPVVYQMYNNIFGEDAAMETSGRITQIRIGYPDPNQDDYDNGTSSGIRNPINCYLDVYIPNMSNVGTVGFNMNYSGFADSHNCEPIIEETDATDIGIYGEKLIYHTMTLKENGGFYMPEDTIEADTVKANSIPYFLKVTGVEAPRIDKVSRTEADFGKYGFQMDANNSVLMIARASNADIDQASNGYKPITPKNVKYAVEKYTADIREKAEKAAVINDTAVGADAWSSRNIVDKLCPAFTVSGYVAVCEPLEGYPLEVVSTIDTGADSITLTRCGKNLFDFNSGTQQLSWVDAEGTTFRYKGYAIKLPPGTYTIHCEQVSGITEKDYYIGTITVDANGVSRPRDTVGSGAIYWGNEATRITRTITIADGDILYAYDGQTNHTEAQADDRFSRENIQLEAGSAATAYEPYRGQTFTAEVAAAEGSYRWQTIPALAGTNVLYSDCGDTTVSGRLDPVPLLMKEV